MELLFVPLQLAAIVLITFPPAALLPALLFTGLFFLRRQVSVAIAAGAWFAYTAYESLMYLRVLCSGECNIRIDLLVLYPALFVVSLVALAMFWWRRRARGDA